MRWRPFLLAFGLLSALGAGGPIRVGLIGWTTLNPLLLAMESDGEAVDLIFDRLVTLDAKGDFIPELLESWTILPGGREVILKLRPGLTWQDGRPIEAEDLVFTWKALRLPQVRKLADTAGVASFDHLSAEGPLTVRIRLKRPRGTLLSDLYHFIPVPRHRYQVGADPRESPMNFAPVGSGPYRVVGKATTERVCLESWDGYRGPHQGRAEAFEWVRVDEGKALIPDFEAERLHYAFLHPLHYYLARKGALGSDAVQALSVPFAAFVGYFLNCDARRSLLGDVALRRALGELLPWQDLARGRRFFPSRLATGIWPPESWAYDPRPQPLPSPERAASLLEGAGWKLGPDGLRRDEKGRPLVLRAYELELVSQQQSPTHLLAAQARRVGIQMEVQTLPMEELYQKAEAQDGDLWTFGWTLSLDPDVDSPLFTREGYRSKSNVSAYLNPEMDRLFDQGRHTLDPEARRQIYLQISEMIHRDKPVIPISYLQTRVLAHRRLQGVAFNRLGQSHGFWPGRRGWVLGD